MSDVIIKAKAHALKNMDMLDLLEPAGSSQLGFTFTKVIGTIGPSSQPVEVLKNLLDAGMSGARVDLTWGPLEFHKQSLDNLQAAMQASRKLCAIVVDTLGREILVRRPVTLDSRGWPKHLDQPVTVSAGQNVILSSHPEARFTSEVLPVAYEDFPMMVEEGDTVYVGRYLVSGADQASLYLEVKSIGEDHVVCEAKHDAVLGGLLTVFHVERSADGLENLQNNLPVLSPYDQECLRALAQDYEIDVLSLAYVRDAEDIQFARQFLQSIGLGDTQVYAKMETRQALMNFEGILAEADGIIFSRGNLGLDVAAEKMALVQKTLVQSCNLVGKPCIITRVVDTMVNTPRPTRAEATDVANAVLDGVDGILLGAETLRGKYCLDVVQTVLQICRQAELVFDHHEHFDHLMDLAMVTDRPPQPEGRSSDGLKELQDSQEGRVLTTDGTAENGSGEAHLNVRVKALRKAPTKKGSYSRLSSAIHAMASYGGSSYGNLEALSSNGSVTGQPHLSKLESIASSAVRVAQKIAASLIVVYTHTGQAANLVSKYRPPMPILTLVMPEAAPETPRSLQRCITERFVPGQEVPEVASRDWNDALRCQHARQCLLVQGVIPVLASPEGQHSTILNQAVKMAHQMGLVQPHQHIVVLQRLNEDFAVMVISVDELGTGMKRINSLGDELGKQTDSRQHS